VKTAVKYINLHKINIFDLIILSVFSIYIIRNVFKFNTAYYIVSVTYTLSLFCVYSFYWTALL